MNRPKESQSLMWIEVGGDLIEELAKYTHSSFLYAYSGVPAGLPTKRSQEHELSHAEEEPRCLLAP